MIHLTGHNYNSQKIVQNIFSPLVGVVSSPSADEVCHHNNLSFVELLQPFAKLPNDARIRDATVVISISGLHLNICDVDWRPPQTVLARKMLNEAVTNAHEAKTKLVRIGKLDLELPCEEPWFENWRETFLAVQFPADHEFTRHFLSCLIVLSSDEVNIVETATKLTQRVHQMQSITPQKLPKWFHPSGVLNSYVVLHEGCRGDLSQAQQAFEHVKSNFPESECFLIELNSLDGSANTEIPDYWASYIKRQPKTDTSTEVLSMPKTPQDAVSVISMPTMSIPNITDITRTETEMSMLHPLSPMQENAMEAINSTFSISSESIASQTINPNVWAADMDADASHGGCLTTKDVENLRHFVGDYALRALIPYVEGLISNLSEAVTNKKGVSKSMISMTKRWFVTNKPGAGVNNQNAVIYTHESAELQTRKLGDLCFMFGHYNSAFQAYHQAKQDFKADSAWQYYAGALEMAAIAAFMLGTSNRKTYDYMEDAIMCYMNCKLQQFATRATLLSIECLKTARIYGECAKQLVRMTSEESDLRSALLLEQAAYCYLASNPSMHRKYAFHIVLSGNRYSRAGQRKHAYRCYRQAYQVFQNRDWSLAEDHIQCTMAKQAYTLKRLEEASYSFAHLLRPGSLQSAKQQLSFLKEYIQTQNEVIKHHVDLGILPLAVPKVVQDSVRILLLPHPPIVNQHCMPANNINIESDQSDEQIWQKIEEMLVITAASGKPFVFKASRSLFTKANPTPEFPLAVQNEPIELAVTVMNTLKCGITLTDMDLLWQLELDKGEMLSNKCLFEGEQDSSNKTAVCAAIKTSCNHVITLENRPEEQLHFKLTPKLTGKLTILGIVGKVAAALDPSNSLLGSLYFESQKIKSAAKQSTQTLLDNKLSIQVTTPVPSLSVSFSTVPENLVAGEILGVKIHLRNASTIPIDDILVGCDTPRWISFPDKDAEVPLSILASMRDLSNEKLAKDKEVRRQHVFRLLKPKNGVSLKAQEDTVVPIYIQAPYHEGDFSLRLLFYYGFSCTSSGNMKYRLVRHTWKFNVHQCLRTEITCVVSNGLSGELGLNVDMSNENTTRHSIKAELSINSLSLLCAVYKLNPNKFYLMNQIDAGAEAYLSPEKSANFQCRLDKTEPIANIPPDQILRQRLSSLDIGAKAKAIAPALEDMSSFLAKHETVFFSTNITTEDFNNFVNNQHSHATVALSWAGTVEQNAVKRAVVGQHFVQLYTLYEKGRCPPVSSHPMRRNSLVTSQSICEFAMKNESDTFGGEKVIDTGADEEYWENNDVFVGKRCLLEDESFVVAVKA